MARVLHAGKSGFFPFCIKNVEDSPLEGLDKFGAGTRRPLGMSLKEVMKLYWVLRKATISGSFVSATETQYYGFYSNSPSLYPYGNPVEKPASSEDEIVCSSYAFIEKTEFGERTVDGKKELETVSMRILIDPFIKAAGEYWPVIILASSTDVVPGNDRETFTFFQDGSDPVPETSIDFFGLGNLFLYRNRTQAANPLSLKADLWWDYDKIYDPLTGNAF